MSEEPFEYSSFPGRCATPLAGAVLTTAAFTSGWFSLARDDAWTAMALLIIVLTAVSTFARWMLGDGVLTVPWMRARGVNLVAERGAGEPRVWLVAHIDSKSQPVPSAARVAGVALLATGIVLAGAALALKLLGGESGTLMVGALFVVGAGGLPVMASVVGSRSDGAVDNASGVAAVLAAAALVGPNVAIGVLVPSAEELGLAGARAWAQTRAVGTALNCDGVDDGGALVIMYNDAAPEELVGAVRRAATRPVVARRMPLGLLTDSTALAHAGWRTVTVSHGSLATLRRIHTERDSLANLRGTKIDEVAVILARAAEALA